MDILLCIFIGIIGLCWGSFLNVLIVRTVTGESIIYPPSKCPKCQHSLYWWHNIPILSFLILHGKCYFCNKTISIRYPIVELLGMAIVLISFYRYISVFDAISVIIILSLGLVMSFTDIQIKKISFRHAIPVIIAGLIFNRYDVINSILGGFVSAGILSTIILLGRNFLNRETFGIGDIYLFGALGVIIGFDKILLYYIYLLIIQFALILPNYIMTLIRQNKGKTLKYLIIFCITCLFLYVSKNITFWGANIILAGFWGILLFSSYKLITSLLNDIKTDESCSYSPLAPAFTICCLLFLC